MRNRLLHLLLMLPIVGFAQRHEVFSPDIASLQVVAGNRWLDIPLIQLGGNEAIHISFDDLTHEYRRYTYRIEHCEADWTVTEGLFTSDFVSGFAEGNTIDDIEVDMVEQYQFEAEAISGDTAMYPGTEAVFRFRVHNTGYDPVDISAHPSNEFFTNFSFYSNGVMTSTFPTQPDEYVEVTCHATLRPEIEPGTVAWLDVHMTIPCNCNTAMVTFWVTPLDITQTEENEAAKICVYPNPTTDFVTVEAEDLQSITLYDINGKTLSSMAAKGNSVRLDVSDLKAGVYIISAKTRSTSSFVKSILKM